MITLIRKIECSELNNTFLLDFDTCQAYCRMWTKQGDEWFLKPTSTVRNWSDEKKYQITKYLSWLLGAGGQVLGAFSEDRLVGFLTLDKSAGGSKGQYRNLSMLFVDARYRRRGVGRSLFAECVKMASGLGAEKLFISSIPAEDTVAFYFAMGCEDAKETIPEWVDMPYDRYLEYTLQGGAGK